MHLVPTLHIPMNKALIRQSLADSKFMVKTKTVPDVYRYTA